MPAQGGDIGKTLQLTCYLGEGIATRRDIIEDGGGRVQKGVTYDNQISLGDVVTVWSGALATEWPIVSASGTDTEIPTSSTAGFIGVVISAPYGPVPAIAADGGTATLSTKTQMRTAQIEWTGFSHVRRVVVAQTNVAGTRLGYDATAAQFTSDVATVSWLPYVLLESSTAGGTHPVMFD